jgi:Flp pilus assembly pilin Flp
MVTGTMDKVVTKKGAGNKEASGFLDGAFTSITNALWMLAWVVVFIIEAVLSVGSLLTSLVSLLCGIIAAVVGAIAGLFAKVSGIFSDLRDEIKAAYVNWKAKQDRIAAKAKHLEAMES